MKTLSSNPKMLLVSSFPPRECGIATFTQDLSNAINKIFGDSLPVEICALENNPYPGRKYGEQVSFVLHTADIEQYRLKADEINERNDIGMVCMQHEFGLFKGIYGDAILSFMLALNKPIVTVFHTVLPNPDEKRKKVVDAIYNLSERIIVQTRLSAKMLTEEYGCSKEMIAVIPHGTHITLWKDKERLKKKYGYAKNIVLSTFGLLSENKNIETVLYALPEIVAKYPETRYLVLGKTHPEVLKTEGEQYRDKLITITKQLKLQKNVVFVNKYLELSELLEYLNLSDIYLFSSKDPNQAVSGTFVYANSAGCPVVSTPIPHALEIIGDGTGILLSGFERPDLFTKAISDLLNDKKKRISLGQHAFAKMRATSWENVALAYGNIFGALTNKAEDLIFQLPRVNIGHFQELTTDFGMIQFSHFSKPDLGSGYALDDNARALIAILIYYNIYEDGTALELAKTYLSFFGFTQQDDGWFKNYVDYNQNLTRQNDEVNLEDTNGTAIWALGYALSQAELLPSELAKQAEKYWNKVFPVAGNISSPRAIGFVIKGLYYHNKFSNQDANIKLADNHAKKLLNYFHLKSDTDWKWYEDYMTYANSILPESMMYAFLMTGNKRYKEIAEITFDFLLSHYFMKGQIKVISNKGWFNRRNQRNFFGEQPIEVAYIIFTLDLFYEVTGKNKYKNQLEIAFSWFLGNNHLNQIMYNPANGACYDGLEESHININQGAESTVCYFMARLVMEKYITDRTLNLKNSSLFTRNDEITVFIE